MSTTTTNYGLIKPDTTDPILVGQLNDNADVIDATLKSLSDALDVAKLGIKYKGEVNYYSNLPSSGNQIGDAYTVKYAGSSGTTPDGTEYVWGTVSGTNQWINFSKDSYTKAEVDALLALKVDTAGTGLSKSGTTLNHSNSTTAKTTQGFAQIAYDAQGHITGSTAATTAQANAINSGIDSTKVAQIETNKNNISKQQNTTAQGGNGYAIINGVRQYTGDTIAPPVPPNSLWLKDSVKVKTDNYFNVDDFGAIQVNAQGDKRCGTNCGILPQGTYTLSATTSAPQNPLFHTIKSGSTYTVVTIDSIPYTFTADGVSEQIIRVANATTTSWAENGYTNIMLNTGNTAESYTPYWTDVIDEKIKPLENNILLNARNGVSNYINAPDVTISGAGYVHNNLACNIPVGNYYLKYTSTQEISGNAETIIRDSDNNIICDITETSITGNNIIPFTLSSVGATFTLFSVRAGTYSNFMIIPKSLYDAGFTDYQPYAMSNAELTAAIQALQAQLANQ